MKRMMSLVFSSLLLLLVFSVVPAGAVNTNITLRVGLYYESTALDTARLENVDTAGYALGYYQDGSFLSVKSVTNTKLTMSIVNGAFQVADSDSGVVLYTAAVGTNLAIRPNSRLTWFKGYKWYGNFEYRRASNGNIAVINYVGMDDYVKGVIPYEVSADWPMEALKAQAVCARSYALGSLGKHSTYGFDVCNTTNCQVYRGANLATAYSDSAVDATRGQYLEYGGKPVIGFFFSSDGGATEDATNVWGGEYPYLKGKIDPYEDVKNAYNGSWSVTLTAAEVKSKLAAAGYTIGTVANVQVTSRTATDNVYSVTVTDTAGKTVLLSKSAVRTVFGLNSIRYTVTGNGGSASVGTHVTYAANTLSASLSTHKVKVDNKAVSPQGYLIAKENYFKLRDIATILNGTKKQFNVTWDPTEGEISLKTGTAYQSVGGEMSSSSAAVSKVSVSTDAMNLNGKTVSIRGYKINGNNYYRVRDVASAIDFAIDYDSASSTVLINSSGSYTNNSSSTGTSGSSTYASFTFTGTGWGHSVGMSQYGALAMAEQGFSYEEILKFYYTGITVQTAA